MVKRLILLIATIIVVMLQVSCKKEESLQKYQADFFELFDTYTILVGYAENEEDFKIYSQAFYDSMSIQHKYFDIYNNYDGLNNLKTINDNAGIQAVKVDTPIIDLLEFSKEMYTMSGGIVNVAMGSILSMWHDYREDGLNDIDNAELPPMELLMEAAKHVDIENLIINREEGTVYLSDPYMSLDVGSLAKGYATSMAIEAAKKSGMKSALVSAGGNIISVGKPLDNIRNRWGVGIQDPNKDIIMGSTDNVLDTIYVNDKSVVTSGSYQRYYVVDGKAYNHIIDPDTLMPAENYAAVTIVCDDSGVAEMLSTYAYILPIDKAETLLDHYDAAAIWVMYDGSLHATDSYKTISKNMGGYSAEDR